MCSNIGLSWVDWRVVTIALVKSQSGCSVSLGKDVVYWIATLSRVISPSLSQMSLMDQVGCVAQ